MSNVTGPRRRGALSRLAGSRGGRRVLVGTESSTAHRVLPPLTSTSRPHRTRVAARVADMVTPGQAWPSPLQCRSRVLRLSNRALPLRLSKSGRLPPLSAKGEIGARTEKASKYRAGGCTILGRGRAHLSHEVSSARFCYLPWRTPPRTVVEHRIPHSSRLLAMARIIGETILPR